MNWCFFFEFFLLDSKVVTWWSIFWLGILEPAGTLLVRWLFQPFDMLRRLGAFGGTKVSKAKMNLQLQDAQLVAKTHRTLNIFTFHPSTTLVVNRFSWRKQPSCSFQKRWSQPTFGFCLLPQFVESFINHRRQVSRQNKRQTFWASALMPLWRIDRKASNIFLGRLADYRKKQLDMEIMEQIKDFFETLKMTWNVFFNLTNVWW